LRFRKIWR